MQSAPVQYVEIIAGQRHFACNRLHATISSTSCADRFRRASTAEEWPASDRPDPYLRFV